MVRPIDVDQGLGLDVLEVGPGSVFLDQALRTIRKPVSPVLHCLQPSAFEGASGKPQEFIEMLLGRSSLRSRAELGFGQVGTESAESTRFAGR